MLQLQPQLQLLHSLLELEQWKVDWEEIEIDDEDDALWAVVPLSKVAVAILDEVVELG